MYTKQFIEKIKSCGIVKYASQYTQLEKSGYVYQGRCPHPDHNDSDPSFRVFIDQKTGSESWACMGCHCGKKDNKENFGSDNIAFVRWMSCNKKSTHVLNFVEAVKILAEFYCIPIEEDKYEYLYIKNMNNAIHWHNNLMMPDNREAFMYLINRGIDYISMKKWLIGYDGDRITFPIFDRFNNVIGFSNRMFGPISTESKQKYKNSPSSPIFDKSSIFYGIQNFNNNRKHILIVEGQIDVILAHKYGIDIAVAPMTSHLSDNHIGLLKKMGKTPILCFDNDPAGAKGLIKTVDILRSNNISPIKFLPLPEGMDMADAANYFKDGLQEYMVDKKKLYSQHEIGVLLDKIDSRINEILLEYMPSIRNTLKSINDDNEQHLIKNFVVNRLRLWKDDAII